MTEAQLTQALAAFDSAAAAWERVITADVPDLDVSANWPPFNGCGGAGHLTAIDDIVIDVSVAKNDGRGGVLGSAGYCARTGTLPRAGIMTFDSEDVDAMLAGDLFGRVVMHEMGHVLGIGTMWQYAGYLDVSGDDDPDPRYTGPAAVAEWNTLSGNSDAGVPIENSGGSGTKWSHWRESRFHSELMTGWISLGSSPLSRVSIASLADLGYQVDLSQADPYVLESALLGTLAPRASAHSETEAGFVLLTPEGPIGND